MKYTLLIMAAGLGSRYGGGIKQLEAVGPNGEIIMDYSIHDAIEAGFDKIIFVIRKDIEEAFHAAIGNRMQKVCDEHGVEMHYAFQDKYDIPEGFEVPEDRTKPWGTGQAVLAARDIIHEPFAVINADDYYGKECFVKIHDFMTRYDSEKNGDVYCMGGFILKNTLSDFGTVTRGICHIDEKSFLTDIKETKFIEKTVTEVDGQVMVGARTPDQILDPDSYASMNIWGLTPEFVQQLKADFVTFFEKKVSVDPLGAEYLIPIYIDELLSNKKIQVKVLETRDRWFGFTYKEDKPGVIENFNRLIEEGVYQKDLFSDLK